MSTGLDYKLSDLKISFKKRNKWRVQQDKHISFQDSFVTFFSSTLGMGLLSIPLLFAYAGILQATLILFLSGFLMYHGNFALLQISQKVSAKSYYELLEKALGKTYWAIIFTFLFLFNILSASICYIIAIQWSLTKTIAYLRVQFKIESYDILGDLISAAEFHLLGHHGQLTNHSIHILEEVEELSYAELVIDHSSCLARSLHCILLKLQQCS